ncbi:hypothetical protein IC620_07665 [Hazenella sp. IB182357]|uniref:Phospholipid phosphatase n=1 Tax=Polycladospora coralii TaxID=2771432 RepID=A0A926RT16_9BACL|nr:hypothetical protein [Polycladospora coralii]MBD1372240.1 hypothetical protein [Polycladospora coralii]MBS7530739.1 hypothetical protein [Polycladospora coralii]
MEAVIHLLLIILYGILFLWSFRSFQESSFWGTSWVLFLIVTLLFENVIILMGSIFEPGRILEGLNLVRYLLHVLLMPTLVFVALDILRRTSVEWSQYMVTQLIYNLYTFVLTVVGIFIEVIWNDFTWIKSNGMFYYVAVEENSSFLMLFTLIPLMIAAVSIWRKLHWPVLLYCLPFAVAGGAIGYYYDQVVIVSLFELVLMWMLVMTEQKLKQEDFFTPDTLFE